MRQKVNISRHKCGHIAGKYEVHGHCGEMPCWNYRNKCPVHCIAASDPEKICTLVPQEKP